MDAASADCCVRLVRGVEDRPWLIVVTRREQQDGFVAGRRHQLYLPAAADPLDPAAALEPVQMTLGDQPLCPSALTTLAVRRWREPPVLGGSGPGGLQGRAAAAQLPEPVEGLVTSQIDRLDPADRLVRSVRRRPRTEVDEAALDGLLEQHDARVFAGR